MKRPHFLFLPYLILITWQHDYGVADVLKLTE
jgi:hypothetical protein